MFDDVNKISLITYIAIGTFAVFRLIIYPGVREMFVYGAVAVLCYGIAIYYGVKIAKENK